MTFYPREAAGATSRGVVAPPLSGAHSLGVAPLRGKVHDARGPAWTRMVLPALGVCGMLAGLFWLGVDGTLPGADFFSGLALTLSGSFLLGRHSAKVVRLQCAPGRVRLAEAGLLTQTIRAKDIVGVTSHTTDDGTEILAMQRRDRDAPTTLELRSADEAKAVKDALGIGVRTSGLLRFQVGLRKQDRLWATNRALASLASAVLAYASITGAGLGVLSGVPLAYLLVVFPLGALASLLARSPDASEASVWLTEADVRLQDGRGGWTAVPHRNIEDVSIEDGWLLVLPKGGRRIATRVRLVRHALRGLSAVEAQQLVLHLRAAAVRARARKKNMADAGAASPLARRPGELTRAWLARLETTATQLTRGSTYRDISIAESDLWSILEDHDADPELRAACARVLSRFVPSDKMARIDAVTTSIRDGTTSRLVRAALLPDLDRAAEDFDDVDAYPDRSAARGLRL